jgi:NADPH:quinone reductase-like Zn-dependent oxidoreductase
MATMKSIRVPAYGGPEKLRYEEMPSPQPASGQVLVRVHAASVNPFDFKLASGAFSKFIPMTLPYTPGSDFSGVVEATGEAVYGNCPVGAYAELVSAPSGSIAPKPTKLSHIEAASVPVAGQTAWQGLFDHGRLERGQTVLIHAAAGGVGSFAVQLAHWKGARVLATASASNADYLRSLGADIVIDYKATPFESVAKDIDLVFDLVGGQTQARSFAVLKPGGRLVATSQPPPQDQAAQHKITATMMEMQASTQNLKQLANLLDAGVIRAVVSKTFPLAEAATAWRQMLGGHTRGKTVLEVA